MRILRHLALATVSLGALASTALAGKPVWNAGLSTASITHDYDLTNGTTALSFSTPVTIQGATPTVSTINSFILGDTSTKVNLGIGHYESTTSAKQ